MFYAIIVEEWDARKVAIRTSKKELYDMLRQRGHTVEEISKDIKEIPENGTDVSQEEFFNAQ